MKPVRLRPLAPPASRPLGFVVWRDVVFFVVRRVNAFNQTCECW